MFKKVLIVCHANICRSPLAEALFRQSEPVRKSQINVQSAGIAAYDGGLVDPKIQEYLVSLGMSAADHRSRRLNGQMARDAELVLVMQTNQLAAVEQIDTTARGKVHLLGRWSGEEINDPHNRDDAAYQMSFDQIQRSVSAWISKIC